MRRVDAMFERTDTRITDLMARHGLPSDLLSSGLLSPGVSRVLLAAWEVIIGAGLLSGFFILGTLLLLFLQMLGTMTPFLLFPNETFSHISNAPTLEGQYIIKNLVLISAGMALGSCVHGGIIVANLDVSSVSPEHYCNIRILFHNMVSSYSIYL